MLDNFDQEGTELVSVTPDDWIEEPDFVEDISAKKIFHNLISLGKHVELRHPALMKSSKNSNSKDQSTKESTSNDLQLDIPHIEGMKNNEGNENNNVVPSTDSTLSKIKQRMNPLSKSISYFLSFT